MLVWLLWLWCGTVLGMVLHMMWTTPAFTMQHRHLAVLQSYLLHHPEWRTKLYVTDSNWPY